MLRQKITKWVPRVLAVFILVAIILPLVPARSASASSENRHSGGNGKDGGFEIHGEWIDRHQINITSIKITDKELLNPDLGAFNDLNKVNDLLASHALGKYTSKNVSPDSDDRKNFYAPSCGPDNQVNQDTSSFTADGNPSNTFFFNSNNLYLANDKGRCVQVIAAPGGLNQDRSLYFDVGTEYNKYIWFTQKTGTDVPTIDRVDGVESGFSKLADSPLTFKQKDQGSCTVRVVFKGPTIIAGINEAYYETCDGSHSIIDPVRVNISNISDANKPGGNPGGGGGTTDSNPRCESGGLSWVVCPIINGLAGASDTVFTKFVKPWLETDSISVTVPPAGSGQHNYIFEAWSNLRIYGNILLVIGMLIIVFGQSIGGGLIDAYTAKKVMPRILAAAIMINLSIYIVAALVDITNVIGSGINVLLTGLIQNPGAGTINLSLSSGASILPIAGLVGAGGAAWALGGTLIQPLLLFVLLPLLMALVAVVVTIVLRQGLIMLLIIVSPIAFALYCLPNTEQYFRKWWKLLFEALLVYPIVGAVFGIANLMAVTINQANTNDKGVTSAVAQIISLIVLIIPLFLIPYSFKLAGGLLGNLHAQLTGFGKKAHQGVLGNVNDPNSARNRSKRNMSERFTRRRERAYDATGSLQKKYAGNKLGNRMLVRGLGAAGATIGMGDLEAKRSALNKQESEIRELKSNYGPDSSLRALYARKNAAGHWISTIDNKTEYSEQDVRKARSLYAGNLSGIQTDINYEVGKVGDDQEYQNFLNETPRIMSDFGYNEGEVNSALKGVGFINAAKRLDLKHTSFKKDDQGNWSHSLNIPKFTRDASENFGSYSIAQMKTSPIDALDYSYDAARTALATGQLEGTLADGRTYKFGSQEEALQAQNDVISTARTLDSRMRRGDFGQVGQTEDGQPITSGASGAAGRVNDKIQALVGKVIPQGPGSPPRPGATGTPSGAGNGEGLIIP